MQKNEVQIFSNAEFGQIRSVECSGRILFCGSDVANALGYADAPKAIKTHCKADGWAIYPVIDSMGRKQQAKFIDEGNLYRLITHSKLDTAEHFESWVFDDVLPSLRKTGVYEMPKKEKADKPDRTRIMEMNARSRMAQTYLKLSQVDTLSSTYKSVLVAKASQVLSGEELIPLPKSEQKVYSAAEIGDMFGVSANKIGRIANQHELKVDAYGEYRRSKSEYSAKEVDTWVYFDTVIPAVSKILGMEVMV